MFFVVLPPDGTVVVPLRRSPSLAVPPARKKNDLEGRIVKDGVRKAVRERQTALADLVHAVRQYRTLAEKL
jgi:hypothetical protein